jgi:hypothetical protein
MVQLPGPRVIYLLEIFFGGGCLTIPEAQSTVAAAVRGAGEKDGRFSAAFTAPCGKDFTKGKYDVSGTVAPVDGEATPLGGTPACIENGEPAEC